MAFFLGRETDAAQRRIFILGNRLNEKERIASGAFLPVQSVLDEHPKEKQESRNKDETPVFEPLDGCHCQHQNGEKREKDEQE
ncbi:MAG: hypothetical protein RBT16_14930 [Desulfococcus multivorans]|nr:hypothetical protein [Desulfococcus multivorans]